MKQERLYVKTATALLLYFGFYCISLPSFALGERLIDQIISSDFIFDRDTSNVPFFPLGYLTYSQQDSLEFDGGCAANVSCVFDYRDVSQGLGLPVWVGQKNMLVLGETLDSDHFEFMGQERTINSAGLLAAWVAQPNQNWQVAAFLYHYKNVGDDEYSDHSKGHYNGAVGRYRHSEKVHSYWGLVHYEENSDSILFPYVGFDWYIDKYWSISAVAPWPSVNYAPKEDWLFRFGALYAGSTWAIDPNNEVGMVNFGKWDLGISVERRLHKLLWGAITVGKSSFGSLTIENDSDIEFESEITNSWFFEISLNVRPAVID